MTTSNDHQRYEVLLVKAVDGVLTQRERVELDAHLRVCDSCRAELEDFTVIKETTDAMTMRILQDARIEPARESGTTRAILGVAFALVFAGLLTLLGFGCYELLTNPSVEPIVKVATATAGAGVLLLLAVVLRARARGLKRDPYGEIDR